MEPSFVIIFSALLVLTCLLSFVLGHRTGAQQMERIQRQHSEVVATMTFLLANGVSLLPDAEDEPTDETPTPAQKLAPKLLLFKRGEEKSDNDTPHNKE